MFTFSPAQEMYKQGLGIAEIARRTGKTLEQGRNIVKKNQ